MITDDLIRGLSSLDKRSDRLVYLTKFVLGQTDARTHISKFFTVFAVSKPGIVTVLVSDGAVIDLFVTAIADVRCMIEPFAPFFFEIGTGLIAGRTGGAFDSTQNDLVTDIGFLATISVNTEVMRVVKRCPCETKSDRRCARTSFEMVVGSLQRNRAISLKDTCLIRASSIYSRSSNVRCF